MCHIITKMQKDGRQRWVVLTWTPMVWLLWLLEVPCSSNPDWMEGRRRGVIEWRLDCSPSQKCREMGAAAPVCYFPQGPCTPQCGCKAELEPWGKPPSAECSTALPASLDFSFILFLFNLFVFLEICTHLPWKFNNGPQLIYRNCFVWAEW